MKLLDEIKEWIEALEILNEETQVLDLIEELFQDKKEE